MIGFRGISEEAQREHEADITKEAQEASIRNAYGDALGLQQMGDEDGATTAYKVLLRQPLVVALQNRDAVQGVLKPDVDLMPYMKYLSLKNLAAIETSGAFCIERWKEGLHHYAQAVELDSSDVTIWYKMAVAACQAEQLSLARFALENALVVNQNHWLSVELLVEVLLALGDSIACKFAVEQAHRINPAFERGKSIVASLGQKINRPEVRYRWVSPAKCRPLEDQPAVSASQNLSVESWQGLLSQLVAAVGLRTPHDEVKSNPYRAPVTVEMVLAPASVTSTEPEAANAGSSDTVLPGVNQNQVSAIADTADAEPETANSGAAASSSQKSGEAAVSMEFVYNASDDQNTAEPEEPLERERAQPIAATRKSDRERAPARQPSPRGQTPTKVPQEREEASASEIGRLAKYMTQRPAQRVSLCHTSNLDKASFGATRWDSSHLRDFIVQYTESHQGNT